ncbi:hypothetical protein PG995_003197 [Apiospora arundinis]
MFFQPPRAALGRAATAARRRASLYKLGVPVYRLLILVTNSWPSSPCMLPEEEEEELFVSPFAVFCDDGSVCASSFSSLVKTGPAGNSDIPLAVTPEESCRSISENGSAGGLMVVSGSSNSASAPVSWSASSTSVLPSLSVGSSVVDTAGEYGGGSTAVTRSDVLFFSCVAIS